MLGVILLGRLLITGMCCLRVWDVLICVLIVHCREWAAGFTDRFGCVWVDFESEEKTRYPKESAHLLGRVFEHLISK